MVEFFDLISKEHPVCWGYAGLTPPQISNGMILINSDHEDAEIRACLASEILKIYGLFGQLEKNAPSARAKDSKRLEWSDLDRKILSVLYNSRLEPGMDQETAEKVIRP